MVDRLNPRRSLVGARRKIDRADEQIDTLVAEFEAALLPGAQTFAVSLTSGTYLGSPAYTLTVAEVPVLDLSVGIVIGEIIHNCRSALDHLAWSLVTLALRRTIATRAARDVYYPMARSRRSFWNTVNTHLPGTTKEQQRFIERYQPYRRSQTGRAVRTLRSLSNTDKHRILVPTHFIPLGLEAKLTHTGGNLLRTVNRLKPGRKVKHGTELMTWIFAGEPRNVSLQTQIGATPPFDPALIRPHPGTTIENVYGALTDVTTTCRQILAHFDVSPEGA